jgi:hypothetical protein
MKQEGAHDYDSASANDALDLSMLLAHGPRRVGRQPTMSMLPGYDAEWTTLGAAVIEMHTHGDERFKHGHGRLDI